MDALPMLIIDDNVRAQVHWRLLAAPAAPVVERARVNEVGLSPNSRCYGTQSDPYSLL